MSQVFTGNPDLDKTMLASLIEHFNDTPRTPLFIEADAIRDVHTVGHLTGMDITAAKRAVSLAYRLCETHWLETQSDSKILLAGFPTALEFLTIPDLPFDNNVVGSFANFSMADFDTWRHYFPSNSHKTYLYATGFMPEDGMMFPIFNWQEVKETALQPLPDIETAKDIPAFLAAIFGPDWLDFKMPELMSLRQLLARPALTAMCNPKYLTTMTRAGLVKAGVSYEDIYGPPYIEFTTGATRKERNIINGWIPDFVLFLSSSNMRLTNIKPVLKEEDWVSLFPNTQLTKARASMKAAPSSEQLHIHDVCREIATNAKDITTLAWCARNFKFMSKVFTIRANDNTPFRWHNTNLLRFLSHEVLEGNRYMSIAKVTAKLKPMVDAYIEETLGADVDLPECQEFLAIASEYPHITQITTSRDLRAEGFNMRHCVGGYVQACLDEVCYIFHMDNKTEYGLTIEVCRIGDYHLTIGQTQGWGNSGPMGEDNVSVAAFIDNLNKVRERKAA